MSCISERTRRIGRIYDLYLQVCKINRACKHGDHSANFSFSSTLKSKFHRNIHKSLPDYTASHPADCILKLILCCYITFCCSFNDVVSYSDYIGLKYYLIVNNKFERTLREVVVACRIYLEKQRTLSWPC